jgi:putative endonuclease
MAFVYILRCADDSLYIGSTTDVWRRLENHLDGKGSRYTAQRRPVRLAFYETHPTLEQAVARERQIKRWTRVKKEALIAGDAIRLKYR